MIDLHLHILPGVDDGARTLEESVEMARALVAEGVHLVAATPHVRADYPTAPETMERLVREVASALDAAGIDLEIRSGGELSFDRLRLLDRDELRRFGLAGNPGYLLVEFPYSGWPLGLERELSLLGNDSIAVVLAHPERNPEVQRNSRRLESLVAAGALVQITAASLDGRLGRAARRTSLELLERELVHLVASDGHGPDVRSVGFGAAAQAVGDEVLFRWLTEDVPTAIVTGNELPPRPRTRGPRLRVSSARAWLGTIRRSGGVHRR